MRNKYLKQAQKVTFVVWLVLVLVAFITQLALAYHDNLDEDFYTHALGFQAVSFAIFYLPIYFVVLCLVLLAEYAVFYLKVR